MAAGHFRVRKPDSVAYVAAERVDAVMKTEDRALSATFFNNDLHRDHLLWVDLLGRPWARRPLLACLIIIQSDVVFANKKLKMPVADARENINLAISGRMGYTIWDILYRNTGGAPFGLHADEPRASMKPLGQAHGDLPEN